MADQDELIALHMITVDLVMHLDDEGTGGVDHLDAPMIRLLPDFLGDAVGAENHNRPVRHLVEFLHEHGALLAQRIHDVTAVHNLMTYIDRRAVGLEGQLDDVDCPVHPGTEASRIRQIDFHVFRVLLRVLHCYSRERLSGTTI